MKHLPELLFILHTCSLYKNPHLNNSVLWNTRSMEALLISSGKLFYKVGATSENAFAELLSEGLVQMSKIVMVGNSRRGSPEKVQVVLKVF